MLKDFPKTLDIPAFDALQHLFQKGCVT